MPKTKEFSVHMEDEPGTLATVCRALAESRVNILAFQSIPWEEGESLVRLVVDNPTTAKSVLNAQKFRYKEAEVVQVKLPNRPGELASAASQLGEADININYAYCGSDPDTNAPLLIFGVADVGRAVKILDKAAAAAAGA
ncbi:MAG TPA: ACT domain-containing protein [Pyrinomonadaceae bacterium]|nr:ACT domain-containing protein [Pyrinomonadaceae bacterium]